MSNPELRKMYKEYWKAYFKAIADHDKECDRIFNEWLARPLPGPPFHPPRKPSLSLPHYPKELIGLA